VYSTRKATWAATVGEMNRSIASHGRYVYSSCSFFLYIISANISSFTAITCHII
jgi:hypothetical protein